MANGKEPYIPSEGQNDRGRLGRDFPHPLHVEFPHITVAKQAVQEEVTNPARAKKINGLLDAYNGHLGTNYRMHEPKDFPGVRVPYIDVSVNAVVLQVNSEKEQERLATLPQGKQVLIVEIGGIAFPPFGYPFAHGDRDIHDAMMASSRVEHAMKNGRPVPQERQLIIGYPQTAMGGEVTQTWVDGLRQQGSSDLYARNNAEIIGNILGENPERLSDTKVVLRSVSMGALSAQKTAALLVEQYPELAGHVQVMSQEPVVNEKANKVKEIVRGIQIAAGFLGEGIVHSATNRQLKAVQSLEKQFLPQMEKEFTGGVSKKERKKQKKLQNKAAMTDVRNLLFKATVEPTPAVPPNPDEQVQRELEAIPKGGDIPDELLARKTPKWPYRVYRMYGRKDTTLFSLARERAYRRKLEKAKKKDAITKRRIAENGIIADKKPGLSSLWNASHLPKYRRVKQWDDVLNGRVKSSSAETMH